MGDYSNNLMGGGGGDLTSAGRSTFKTANNLSKLPGPRYSTKGLSSTKPPTAKIRTFRNDFKSIGRKRGI